METGKEETTMIPPRGVLEVVSQARRLQHGVWCHPLHVIPRNTVTALRSSAFKYFGFWKHSQDDTVKIEKPIGSWVESLHFENK